MTYATKQDLIDRYGLQELIKLTDRATPPAGAEDDAVIGKALADADAEINGLISSRVTTPVDPVPSILVLRACMIARYYLFAGRVTDKVKEDYTDALAWLAEVRDGKRALGEALAATAPVSAGKPKIVSGGPRRFTSDTMRDF